MAMFNAKKPGIPDLPELISEFEKRERKREQNRIAQRNYRRNQKERLRALELVAAQLPHSADGCEKATPSCPRVSPAPRTPVCLGAQQPSLCPDTCSTSTVSAISPSTRTAEVSGWSLESVLEPIPDSGTTSLPTCASLCDSSSTPLHVAISTGNESMARILLKHGADTFRRDGNGSTALHLAAEAGNEGLVKLLLESMDPDEVDYSQRTPLFRAVEAGRDDVVMLLLAAGADVNVKDIWGNSALHLAVKAGSERLTLLLLEHGADVDASV